ncbi:MAG: DUF2911 domain-containing protein [Opitutaceae bacterium]|nr:DUF2911 domain-containing protein [Opitutaceae bacterium]
MILRTTRFLTTTLIGTALLAAAVSAQAPARIEFPAASPAASFKQTVGITDIEVIYSRPSMRGRTIFGGLVPYNEVWRTGANQATKIKFSTPLKLNGTPVEAGAYELYTIPGEASWTVIIHKDSSAWGAYTYDAKNDVVRIQARPEKTAAPVETFAIGISENRDGAATLFFTWERVRVPVSVEVDVKGMLLPRIEAVMASNSDKKPYAQAALFNLDNNLDLDKAVTWIDAAIAAKPEIFYYSYHKARILAKKGDKAGAIAAAEKSLEGARKAKGPIRGEYIRLNEELIKSLR